MVALLGESSERIIKLAVDQQDIDRIKTGQEVLVRTDVTGNKILHAVITQLYPTMNETDQTFRVDAVFSDSTEQPFIHSSVEANIIITEKHDALVVPQEAVFGDDSVQVKDDGKTKAIAVQTGIHTLNEIQILKGLDESSEIILPDQK